MSTGPSVDDDGVDPEQSVFRSGGVEHQSELDAYDGLTLRHIDDEDRCPNGDVWCNGLEDVLDGTLPCFECLGDAPDEAVAKLEAEFYRKYDVDPRRESDA